jgi:hypothetical protein
MALSSTYPDFGSYIRGELGPEGWGFMVAATAYKADLFELDAQAYIEFFHLEQTDNPFMFRPLRGMSAFITELVPRCQQVGVQMYLNEPIHMISLATGEYFFRAESEHYM